MSRYKNLDKLIHYANKDGRVNVFYSSPDAYTDAKNSYNTSWPLKTDDFFPYADCATCYWTGVDPNSTAKVDVEYGGSLITQQILHVSVCWASQESCSLYRLHSDL